MSTVQFMQTIERKRAAGSTAFLLRFNTADRYFDPTSQIPPVDLRIAIASHYSTHDVGYYSQSTGMFPLTPQDRTAKSAFQPGPMSETPVQGIARAIWLLREQERRLLIVDFAEFLTPHGTSDGLHPDTTRLIEIMMRLAHDDEIRRRGSFAIGINQFGPVHELIQRNWATIDLPLPSEEDRRQFYNVISKNSCFATLDDGITLDEFADLSRGCRLRDIEFVMRESKAGDRKVTRDDLNDVREVALRSLVNDLLVVRKPSGLRFDSVCGMASFQQYIESVVEAVKRSQHALAPGGILLQGPPGTGKTFIVDAIADAFGYPIVEWRNLKSQWLGQSEANLENCIRAIEALNPVLVLVDEADQVLSGRQEGMAGDGGTGGYMFGRLLAAMGSPHLKGRVLWVLCSNRPDLIDPALADRLGCCVPLLRPTVAAIPGILASLAGQLQLVLTLQEDELHQIVSCLPEQASVRKLRDLLSTAALRSSDGQHITLAHILDALQDTQFSEDSFRIEYWTLLAVQMSTHANLLPWRDGKSYRPEWVPHSLREFVDQDGSLEAQKLDRRIYELRRMIGR